jgi:hypothetical protein
MVGGDPSRLLLAPGHVAADPDHFGDIGKGPLLPPQRDANDTGQFLFERRRAVTRGLIGRREDVGSSFPTPARLSRGETSHSHNASRVPA